MYTPAKIVIATPVEFANFWREDDTSAIKDLFGGQEGNLLTINVISPADYTPISEGENFRFIDGIAAVKAIAEPRRLGFRLKVRDRRNDLRIAIEELIEQSINYSCSEAIALTIYDYCYLRRTDRAQGYRIRQGFFTEPLSGLQGNIARGTKVNCETHSQVSNDPNLVGDRYGGGFSFKFMEIEKNNY